MKISIVIPVINEAASIVEAIERAWDAGGDEVVVVDGGSTDGTVELAQSTKCRFIHSPPGRGIQLNQGANVSTGDCILSLHADGWLENGACQQIRQSAVVGRPLWGGFRQRIDNPRIAYRALEIGNGLRARFQGLIYGDQGLFLAKDVFAKVGGFPLVGLMEDFEISRRLCRISWPRLLPGPVHVGARRWEKNGVIRQTLRNWSITTAYRWGRSPEKLVSKYRRHDQEGS